MVPTAHMPPAQDPFEQQLTNIDPFLYQYTLWEVLLNSAVAMGLGLLLAVIYRRTHKGLDYKQHFSQTIVFVPLIVSIFMMVVGSNTARAFGLMGAVSIIRFRTAVKDTRDTAFIFASLFLGLAAGVNTFDSFGGYGLAAIGLGFVGGLSWFFHITNHGTQFSDKFILRFAVPKNSDAATYRAQLQEGSKRVTLINEDVGEGADRVTLMYDIQLGEEVPTKRFLKNLRRVAGVSNVELVMPLDH